MGEMEQVMQDMPAAADEKAARKAFSKIGWIYLIGILIIHIAAEVVTMILSFFIPDLFDNMNYILVFGTVIPMYAVGFPLVYVMMKKIPAAKPEKRKMSFSSWFLYAFICLGLAYASNIVGNIITTFIGMAQGSAVDNVILNVATSISPWMVLIYMVVLGPIGEELFFRKLIVDRTAKYSKHLAILISGLMFGLFHGNLNQFVYAFIIGCFFAFLYIKTGNIKIPISMHMLFNFIGGFLATNLMKLLDLESILELQNDPAALMEVVRGNLGAWALYVIFLLFILSTVIAGIVLFIVFAVQGKFKVTEAPDALPKGRRAAVAFGNAGMICFIAFWCSTIVFQLLGMGGLVEKVISMIAG